MLEVNGRMKGEDGCPLVYLPSPWSARAKCRSGQGTLGKTGSQPEGSLQFTGRGLCVHLPSSWTTPSLSLNGGCVKCKDRCHENRTDAAPQVAQW